MDDRQDEFFEAAHAAMEPVPAPEMTMQCKRCFGSGWVLSLVPLLDAEGDGTAPCPVCGGSGKL